MAYIGVSPSNGVRQKHTYTATANQTSFSGVGAENVTLSYRDSNYVDVYRNGVKLGDEDYTSTSGTAIVLAEGAAVNDIVEIIVYDVFSIADLNASNLNSGTVPLARLGSSGTKDTTTFLRGDNTFATVSQESTVINNNADNRMITGSATENTLNGEANLTFDGTTLGLTGNQTVSGTLGVTGVLTGTSLDISGDIDVDGTTNLDVVDIDGAVNMASTALVTGVLTANGGAVFNEASADVDFRVESDTVDHALFVQGSDGLVGIGTSSPAGILNVKGTGGDAMPATSGSTQSAGLITRLQQGGAIGSVMDIGGNGGAGSWIQVTEPGDLTANYSLLLNPNGGKVGIGTTAPSSTLELKVASGNLELKLIGATATHGIRNQADGSWGDYDYTRSRWMTLRDYSGDYYQIFTGGTERMRIDSSGNTMVGLTSPLARFSVGGASATASNSTICRIGNADYGSAVVLSVAPGVVNFDAPGVSGGRFKIDSSGNVGIGNASPTGKLDITSGTTYQPHLRITNSAGGGRTFGINVGVSAVSNGYFSLRDETGSANRMVITDSGYILIGNITALPSASVSGFSFSPSISSVNANLSSAGSGTSSVAHFNFLNGNGVVGNIVTSGGGTSFGTSSDYRLKENVDYSFDATTRFKQLKPARFNFITDADTTVDGFLAHEVSSIVPEAIIGEKDAVDNDGNAVMQSIDQSKLVPLLVKTIQELEARITALENGE